MGLLESKPEPVEDMIALHEFMYRRQGILTKAFLNVGVPSLAGVDFEGFLRRTAEEIIDVAVREVISDLDRLIFDGEISDVTS